MNPRLQKFFLKWIDWELGRVEARARKEMKRDTTTSAKNKKLKDYLDMDEYRNLMGLRMNIEEINGFWQGFFNPWWKFSPKTDKYRTDRYPLPTTPHEPDRDLHQREAYEAAHRALEEQYDKD